MIDIKKLYIGKLVFVDSSYIDETKTKHIIKNICRIEAIDGFTEEIICSIANNCLNKGDTIYTYLDNITELPINKFFIRKNTKKLRNELEKLGYKYVYKDNIEKAKATDGSLIINRKCIECDCLNIQITDYPDDGFFDCGDDENLFLMIASYIFNVDLI